ncbi:MAG: hypothetical protein V4757_02295 [Pseudomonadota bacterium]
MATQAEIGECFDTLNDALRSLVQALGGFKKVGGLMQPDNEHADQWLRHCLDGNRREKLSPEQVIWLLHEGRKVNFHAAMDYVGQKTGYKHKPVDLDEQRQALQETIAAGIENLQRQMATLARLAEAGKP